MLGRFNVACRIATLSGFLIVTLGLRQRRLRLIRISMPAEVRITGTLLLAVSCPLVLIRVRGGAITR